ncbi:MAG: OST-HTH/LOTUS domain-containing protein, partial [Gemmatimonadota bacterium]|nr:OST-HTH/LOTUS domain-containing protein [Gemmatimonadota bacterium]
TQAARDPWILVNEALKKMLSRGDVMRSDRLKQVMQELDPLFNERGMGFSKFSKFLAEASSRGLVALKKQENGQYEVKPPYRGRSSQEEAGDKRAPVRGQRQRSPKPRHSAENLDQPSSQGTRSTDDPLKEAYQLLVSVLEDFRTVGREPVRDSDLKRKMLKKNADFDEAELGFPKFSRFLVQATEHGVISTDRTERGNFEVSLPDSHSESEATDDISLDATVVEQETTSVVEVVPSSSPDSGLRLGPRRGSTRRRGGEDLPQLFEGQAVGTSIPSETDSATLSGEDFSPSSIGLPTDPQAIVRYLAHRYKGVGQKTAETLVEQFGPALFQTLRDDPESVKAALPSNRGEQVLVAWKADYARRTSDGTKEAGNRGGRGRR